MFRKERPGVFRHRQSFHSNEPSTYPPACPLRRPTFFPNRRTLINRSPNQGMRPFVGQPNSPVNYRPILNPLTNSRFSLHHNCENFSTKSMERADMSFVHLNNSGNIDENSVLPTFPVIMQKENLNINNPSDFFERDMLGSDELWIETTAPNGRNYYFNASSRISRWDKPDNVKIMNLDLLRLMANGPYVTTSAPNVCINDHPMYAPQNQQSSLRFFSPPQVATGMMIFPPPNLNTPPPFQPAPIVNLPDLSQFPGYSSEVHSSRSIKEPTDSSDNTSLIAHGATLLNHTNFKDSPMELDDRSKEGPLATFILQENDSDCIKLTYQASEEQIPLNESIAEDENESKIRNLPVNSSFPDISDESQKFTSNENDDQNSGKDTVSETVINAVNRSRPVSSTPIPGSKWCVVWTGDEKVFFYDADRRVSVWEMPNELKNRAEVQKLVDSPPILIKNKQSDNASLSKKIKIEEEYKTELNDKNQTICEKKTGSIIIEALKKQEELPRDDRVKIFLQMLSEKNISAFSTMNSELHKVIDDPRYLLLPSKERKQKFESYILEKSEEEKKIRMKKVLEVKEEFKNLLKEVNVIESMRFIDFVYQHSKDPRFKALEKFKDREALFNEYVNNLRKKSRDLDNKRKVEFQELLREQNYADANVDWLDVKKLLCLDDRYTSLTSDSERQKLFEEFKQKYLTRNFQSAKEKEDRINTSIKTREEEVQRELSINLKELNKERDKHKYEAVVTRFKALLADLVRKPDISWREAKRLLKADHRWEDMSALREERRIRYFDDHIDYLISKKREHFHQILSEIPEVTLSSTWKDVKKKVFNDPRCKLFSSDIRKCEREFKEYISNKLEEAKLQFKELMKETKMITYTSKNLMKTSNHLEIIENALEHDNRYLVLKCVEKERKEMLLSYIDKLHRKGPPPPPTSTEFVKH